MTLTTIWNAITKPFRAAWAYRHGGDMMVNTDSGPSGFNGFPPIDDSVPTGAELLEEARGEDPEPTMPAITTTEGKTGKQV